MVRIIILILLLGLLWQYGLPYGQRQLAARKTAEEQALLHAPIGPLTLPAPGLLAADADHILDIAADHTAYGWGSDEHLQVGLGKGPRVTEPVALPGLTETMRFAYTDDKQSMLIDNQGQLWRRPLWGLQPAPFVQVLKLQGWKQVVGGAGLDSDGQLWRQAFTDENTTGQPQTLSAEQRPLSQTGSWRDLCSTAYAIFALDQAGQLWTAPLADGDLVHMPTTVNFRRLSCSHYGSVLALDEHYYLWGTGYNQHFELGFGSDATSPAAPVKDGDMRLLDRQHWSSMALGDDFAVAINADGSLWAWGNNAAEQLGTNDGKSHQQPALVDKSRHWLSVTAGKGFAAGITSSGELLTWGQRGDGVLGDGFSSDDHPSPQAVHGITRWSTSAVTE